MKLLIVDAGHGGSDPGATSQGYVEKELNMVVSRRVVEILKSRGINCDMTRASDYTLIPSKRTELIKNNYEYCLSIHFNAGGGHGIETIHSIYGEKGATLAELIAERLEKFTGLPIRRVFERSGSRGDYYYMHRDTGSTTTVIVECAFLDSPKDIKSINVETMAQAISQGFLDHINYIEKKQIKLSVAKYEAIASTHITEVDPLSLKNKVVKMAGNKITGDFVNGPFFGMWEGKMISIGSLVNEGKVMAEQLPHDNVKRGCFIVYNDGTVKVEMIDFISKHPKLIDIHFAISGFNMFPLNLEAEWFDPAEVGYETWRTVLGYNAKKNKAIIAVRPSSDARRGQSTLMNLGCDAGIGLDSGSSTNTRMDGKNIRTTDRTLYSIITW